MHEINTDIVKINSLKIKQHSSTRAVGTRDADTEILFSEKISNSEAHNP